MNLSVEDRIELEAQSVTQFPNEYKEFPKGYLDGMLWAFDLVLMWMRAEKKEATP